MSILSVLLIGLGYIASALLYFLFMYILCGLYCIFFDEAYIKGKDFGKDIFCRYLAGIIGLALNIGVNYLRQLLKFSTILYGLTTAIVILGVVVSVLALVLTITRTIGLIVKHIQEDIKSNAESQKELVREAIANIDIKLKKYENLNHVISEKSLTIFSQWDSMIDEGKLSYKDGIAKLLVITSNQLNEYNKLQELDDTELKSTTFSYGVSNILLALSRLEQCANDFATKEEQKALELQKKQKHEAEIAEAQKEKEFIQTQKNLDALLFKQEKAANKAFKQIQDL